MNINNDDGQQRCTTTRYPLPRRYFLNILRLLSKIGSETGNIDDEQHGEEAFPDILRKVLNSDIILQLFLRNVQKSPAGRDPPSSVENSVKSCLKTGLFLTFLMF